MQGGWCTCHDATASVAATSVALFELYLYLDQGARSMAEELCHRDMWWHIMAPSCRQAGMILSKTASCGTHRSTIAALKHCDAQPHWEVELY